MNLLLLRADELAQDGVARLACRRLLHAREVLRLSPGDRLRVGLLGGRIGNGQVISLSETELVLRVELQEEPPPRPGVDLLLAMPRPKALKKVLPAIASLGVDRLVLLNAARVEKSYFSSPALEPASIEELLTQGLEQARDTRLPEVLVRERFRPFVEDELDALFAGGALATGGTAQRLVAHPGAGHTLAALRGASRERVLLAIGPEGGWVPFELELLAQRGFTAFTLGPRILRTEVAVPYLLGALSQAAPLT